MNNQWSTIEWRGCYPSNWKGVVVTEAMAHPAKFSSKLIRRIYDHMLEEGWVTAGDSVVDPFGGVALGAFDAMRHGLHWTGIELEERFHKIGNANIDSWMTKYGGMRNWGTARLLHGDSREMCHVLRAMKASEESYQISVSSPPYDESFKGEQEPYEVTHDRMVKNGHDVSKLGKNSYTSRIGYGKTDGQLGGADDFWLSARAIVEQVYQSLTPGGHACWVVKDYVQAKQIVPFSDQWRQLCEAVGFETLHEHRAMLVHHKGRQGLLEGGTKEIKTESKSFFRRLAEKKGSPRIDWEVVWCMRKP